MKTPFCKLWHKTDSTFRRPKSNLYIDVVAPIAYERPSNVCFTRIFTKMLEDELTEFAYDAQCASLDYSVYNCSTVRVSPQPRSGSVAFSQLFARTGAASDPYRLLT